MKRKLLDVMRDLARSAKPGARKLTDKQVDGIVRTTRREAHRREKTTANAPRRSGRH